MTTQANYGKCHKGDAIAGDKYGRVSITILHKVEGYKPAVF